MALEPRQRSAVSNGTKTFLSSGTNNSEVARRFRDLLAEVEHERGGRESMSAVEHAAARAWTALAVLLEQTQASLARGDVVDAAELGVLADRMDRQSRRMGPVKVLTV